MLSCFFIVPTPHSSKQDKTQPRKGICKRYKCTTLFVGQNNETTSIPIQKWARNPNGHLMGDTLQMASGHMWGCSTLSATGEWLIKTKATQHPLTKVQNTNNNQRSWKKEATGYVMIAGKNVKWDTVSYYAKDTLLQFRQRIPCYLSRWAYTNLCIDVYISFICKCE